MSTLFSLALEHRVIGVDSQPVRLAYRHMRSGKPPLLLVHGHPQNHLMWHRVWSGLVTSHDVVAVDLRGYGESDKPPSDPLHERYSKRAMARDLVCLMEQLGYPSFSIMAHDRGARVAHRLALDFPSVLNKLVLLDIAPTLDMYEGTSESFAKAYWHWFFLIQPAPLPEQLLEGRGAAYVRGVMGSRHAGLKPFDPRALQAYEQAAQNADTIRAICEDYRASATIDLDHDRISRSQGQKVCAPTLVLWGRHGVVRRCFNIAELWRPWLTHAQFGELDCGHYLAEEAPEALLACVLPFLHQSSLNSTT